MARKTTKKTRIFIPAEPLKSLEKKGETLKKNKEFLARKKKNKEFPKNKERKEREVMTSNIQGHGGPGAEPEPETGTVGNGENLGPSFPWCFCFLGVSVSLVFFLQRISLMFFSVFLLILEGF